MRLTSLIRSTVTLVVGVVLTNAASIGAGASVQGVSVHFKSTWFEDTNLRYVMNSGICETTPGVTQYSGYITVGKNMSMVCFCTALSFPVLTCKLSGSGFSGRGIPQKQLPLLSGKSLPLAREYLSMIDQAQRWTWLFFHDWAFPR